MAIIVKWNNSEKQLEVGVPIVLVTGVTVELKKDDLVKLSASYQCSIYDSNGALVTDSQWPDQFKLYSGRLVFQIHGTAVTFTNV